MQQDVIRSSYSLPRGGDRGKSSANGRRSFIKRKKSFTFPDSTAAKGTLAYCNCQRRTPKLSVAIRNEIMLFKNDVKVTCKHPWRNCDLCPQEPPVLHNARQVVSYRIRKVSMGNCHMHGISRLVHEPCDSAQNQRVLARGPLSRRRFRMKCPYGLRLQREEI
jgi:hypothetical protein